MEQEHGLGVGGGVSRAVFDNEQLGELASWVWGLDLDEFPGEVVAAEVGGEVEELGVGAAGAEEGEEDGGEGDEESEVGPKGESFG